MNENEHIARQSSSHILCLNRVSLLLAGEGRWHILPAIVDSARGKPCTLTEEVGQRLRIIFQRTVSFNLASFLLETYAAQVAVGCMTAYFCFRAQISHAILFTLCELDRSR